DHLQLPKKLSRIQKVIAWIREHQKAECCPSDLARNEVAGIRTRTQAESVMKELADLGYGRLEERKAANNRKVTWFIPRPGELGRVGVSWADVSNSDPDASALPASA